MQESAGTKRNIRSFVLRSGRITPAQKLAFERLWPRYGVEYRPVIIDFAALFGRRAPIALDIGFGDGDALVCPIRYICRHSAAMP